MKQTRLHVEFMSTPRSSIGYARSVPEKRRDSSLFWWTVIITILLGLATFSWFFSIYVFAHPEKPLNYRILTKFDKISPPKDFAALEVPSGQFLGPKGGYNKYIGMPEPLLVESNALLKRRYLTNYTDESPVYLLGLYRVYQVRELTPADVFTRGLVVRARAHDYPNVVIEYLFPTPEGTAANPDLLAPGDDLALEKSTSFASVINVARVGEDDICFSLVPLVYESHKINGSDEINLSPPRHLNLGGRWPITDENPSAPGQGTEPQVAARRTR